LIALDPKDDSITPWLVREGYWESWISLAVARAIRPGAYCVDGGANVGYYSVLMAARKAHRVLAIEPNPETVALLRQTINLNHLEDTVGVAEVALGARHERRVLHRFGDAHGMDSLLPDRGPTPAVCTWGVDVRPLDELVADWPQVDFVKLDLEGNEIPAWAGMREIIQRNPRIIVCMELIIQERFDAIAFLESLEQAGWPLRVVGETGDLEPIRPQEFSQHPFVRKHEWHMLWLQR
jgi:FkbM family methyltransferase